MKILFITSNRLGDAVLSTGALAALADEYPGADITIVCGPLPAPLFEAMPHVREVIPLIKQKYDLHWIKLWARCVQQAWDIIADLRNSFVTHLLPHKKYYSLKRNNRIHRVEECAASLRLTYVPAPRLTLPDDARRKAESMIPRGGWIIGAGPSANWRGKIWPADRFIELINRLTADDGLFPGARVAVFGLESERDVCAPVLNAVPPDKRVDLIGRTGILETAACLQRCTLYIGNDSGLMHMAAAVETPTLGLFGPSREGHYRPFGQHTGFVRTDLSYDALVGGPGYDHRTTGSLMESLSVDKAEAGVHNLWHEVMKQCPL